MRVELRKIARFSTLRWEAETEIDGHMNWGWAFTRAGAVRELRKAIKRDEERRKPRPPDEVREVEL